MRTLAGGQAAGDTRLEVPSTAEVLGLLGPLPSTAAAGAAPTPTLRVGGRAFASACVAPDMGDGVSLVRGRDAVSACPVPAALFDASLASTCACPI